MTDQEKIEFAKQQINKAISSGQRKEDAYAIVINTAKNLDLANSLFQDILYEDFKTAVKIVKQLTKEDAKERIEESFFLHLEESPLSSDTILGLYTLGRAYQEKYFLDRKELLDELQEIDDYAYDTLIKKEEHLLYINYIEMCYAYTGIVPQNAERLIRSDIKTNTKIQEKIKQLELEMYDSEDYDNLFFLAVSTNTLNNVKEFFQKSSNKIYEIVKRKEALPKTCFYAYFLDSDKSELEQRIEWHEKQINEKMTRDIVVDLIINRYKIRLLELESGKETFTPLSTSADDSTKKYIQGLSKKQQYEIFKDHAKLFNKVYLDSEKYLSIIYEDYKWNPFKAFEIVPHQRVSAGKKVPQTLYDKPVSNFRDNEFIQKYLEKEKEVLKQEAIEFAKNVSTSLDLIIRLYFTSILNYAISFSEFIESLKSSKRNSSFFLIYNTILKGYLCYESGELKLDTKFGKIKVSYTEDSNVESNINPGTNVSANISSYGFLDRAFRITNVTPNKSEIWNEECSNVVRAIQRGNKVELIEDNQRLGFLMELCRINNMVGVYHYLRLHNVEERIKKQVEQLLHFRVDKAKEESAEKIFYEYALGEEKEIITQKLCAYIQSVLEKVEYKATSDLTRDKVFDKFRIDISLMFQALQEIDPEFYEHLMKELKEKNLLSITYWNTDEKDYFEELQEEKYSFIREFYEVYPKYSYTIQEIQEIAKNQKKDTKLYLYLKLLSRNLRYYDSLKEEIRDSLEEDNRYVEWIKRIDLNIQIMGKPTLLNLLKGLPYDQTISEEKKHFVETAKKLFVYEEEPVVGNSLKEVIQGINYSISKERIERIKELSNEELTREEKLELAPVIIEVLENTNCTPASRLQLLKALGKNNPFHINGELSLKDFKWINKGINARLNAIAATISPQERINLYFLSPQHYLVDLFYFAKANEKTITVAEEDYYIRGTVNITNFGTKMTIYPTNILSKENHILGNVNDLKKEEYKMLPHFDEIPFKIKKVGERTVEVEAVIDLQEEEELWRKSLEDRSFFESLYREAKEKVLMHYCRKDVTKAYEFDKEQIIPKEKYIEISELLGSYSLFAVDHLFFMLVLNQEENFIERLTKINRIAERQLACLKLQEKLLEENRMDYFDRYILYLKDLSYLHDSFLLDAAKDIYDKSNVFQENYKKYNKDGFIEKSLITTDIKYFIDIKYLEFEKVLFSHDFEKVDEYINKCLSIPFPTEQDVAYTKFLTYKNVLKKDEIPNTYFEYWKEKEDSFELFDILNVRLDNHSVKVKFNFFEEKAETYEDYHKLILFAKPFLYLKEDAERVILKDEKLLGLKEELNNTNRESLQYYENRLQSQLKEIRKVNDVSLYNIDLIEFVGTILQKAKQYWKLDRKKELKQLVNFMLKNNIPVRGVIHSDEILNSLEEGQRKLVENQEVRRSFIIERKMRDIRGFFDTEKIISSSIYREWKELQRNLEDKIIDVEEIKSFEENLKQDEYARAWKIIFVKKLKQYELPIEEYLFTPGMKETYQQFLEDQEKVIKKEKTKKTQLFMDTLYNYCTEPNRKELTNAIGRIRRVLKNRRLVKEAAFQKSLFNFYYNLYHLSKRLYKNSENGLKVFIGTLRNISILNDTLLYKDISLEGIPDEEIHSRKTYIIDSDRNLFELIDNIYDFDEKKVLDQAKEEDKYYYYLALCYWDKKYIDYKVPLMINEDIESMLKNFITIALYDGVSPEEFFHSLKENNIMDTLDEETIKRIYYNGTIEALKVMFKKTEWEVTYRMMSVIKKNDYCQDAPKSTLLVKQKFVDTISPEYLEVINSYFMVNPYTNSNEEEKAQ
ncbi:MAG: hypothetical protein IJ193_03940 [Bacilli bacterium]|nr:hypothetical protein [Bacilli bacterium]